MTMCKANTHACTSQLRTPHQVIVSFVCQNIPNLYHFYLFIIIIFNSRDGDNDRVHMTKVTHVDQAANHGYRKITIRSVDIDMEIFSITISNKF